MGNSLALAWLIFPYFNQKYLGVGYEGDHYDTSRFMNNFSSAEYSKTDQPLKILCEKSC
jgi:hypothetical protein